MSPFTQVRPKQSSELTLSSAFCVFHRQNKAYTLAAVAYRACTFVPQLQLAVVIRMDQSPSPCSVNLDSLSSLDRQITFLLIPSAFL